MALTTTSNYDVQVVYRTPDGELWNTAELARAHLPKARLTRQKAALIELAADTPNPSDNEAEWASRFVDRLLSAYDLQKKPETVEVKS